MVFPARLWTVEKGSKSCVGRLNEKREMLLSRRPEKTLKWFRILDGINPNLKVGENEMEDF